MKFEFDIAKVNFIIAALREFPNVMSRGAEEIINDIAKQANEQQKPESTDE